MSARAIAACPAVPAGEPCAIQPLLHVRYAVTLDERNQAQGSGTVVTVTGYHEARTGRGSSLAGLKLEVSYDEGATWTALRVTGQGDTRSARLPAAPAKATSVSLRLEASDRAGSRVRQELPKAFGLTG
ncbi:hypothetical protein ACQEUU_08455 [Nonomuraea sp. CA-218870]|uniref:hypothetical protein n=1 Tax=Nonomuraea sp. CA-218870 TaxID=3239998 RepID=UPI003D94E622